MLLGLWLISQKTLARKKYSPNFWVLHTSFVYILGPIQNQINCSFFVHQFLPECHRIRARKDLRDSLVIFLSFCVSIHTEVQLDKWPVQGYIASYWQRWNWNLGSLVHKTQIHWRTDMYISFLPTNFTCAMCRTYRWRHCCLVEGALNLRRQEWVLDLTLWLWPGFYSFLGLSLFICTMIVIVSAILLHSPCKMIRWKWI